MSTVADTLPLDQHFTFFGGKGGAGKTTCAAALAVGSAVQGARVLAVSTDPAHSLGDALAAPLTGTPRQVHVTPRSADLSAGALAEVEALALRSSIPERRSSALDGGSSRAGGRVKTDRRARRSGSLHAVELDAPRAFARWIARHGQALGDVVEHGTWLDRSDIDALIELPVPGVDELVGILEIVRLAGGAYDRVVIDTAPTGHTLRLLAAPEAVASVADVLDALQAEHRLIRDQLARVGRPDAADRLIELLARQAHDTAALLRDRRRTAFEWVMLPDALSLEESADGLRALERARIPVRAIVVNRVLPHGPACPVCDRRRAAERRIIARIPRVLGKGRRIHLLAEEVREPRGVAVLARLGKQWTRPMTRAQRSVTAESRTVSGTAFSAAPGARMPPESIAALKGARLLFFGGKGGVGKTTTAAAAALRLARADASRAVLLLSTDPAHSLADVFNERIGDRPASIAGGPANLHVRELDAPAALAARRADLEAALVEIMSAPGGRMRRSASAVDAAGRLIDLAPPGIDELFAMLTVVDAQHAYPLIVVDMAPTGHALRLLELPEAARDWMQVLLGVLLKYRSLVRPGQFAAELVNLSKATRELQRLLHDPVAARFIVVSRAAELPRLETERLLDRLRRLALAVPAVVINARTLAPGACRRCRAVAAAERRAVAALARRCRRRSGECVIIQTPLAAPPPRGAAMLERWARLWTPGA